MTDAAMDIGIQDLARLLAHDLRNSLVILNGLTILLENNLDPSYFDRMKRQLAICDSLLESFVDSTERQHLQSGPAPIEPIIRDVVDGLEFAEGITIDVKSDPEIKGHLPRIVLKQILSNLLQNAIAALVHRGGCIAIRAFSAAGRIQIEVSDTGPGMPPAVAADLLQRRVRSQEAGMGAGLLLCRRVIEAWNGKLEFRTSKENGTCFCIDVPQWIEKEMGEVVLEGGEERPPLG